MAKPNNKILNKRQPVGLVDADLLCKGTRHPNLVLLKLAGYFRDNGIKYELVTKEEIDLNKYKYIYLSRVFTFTKLPKFIEEYKLKHPDTWEETIRQGACISKDHHNHTN